MDRKEFELRSLFLPDLLSKLRKSSGLLLTVVVFLVIGAGPVHGWVWRTDMVKQPSIKPQEAPRPIPEHSIPRQGKELHIDRVEAGKRLRNPIESNPTVVENGKKLYQIYCALCHGPEAKGNGPVAVKFVPPPDLTLEVIRKRPDGFLYQTITDGGPLMPAQGEALGPSERWEIVIYLRRLQGGEK